MNGKIPVLMDGGVRRGTDVFKALALGAQAVLVSDEEFVASFSSPFLRLSYITESIFCVIFWFRLADLLFMD